jgi:hypothetical protein
MGPLLQIGPKDATEWWEFVLVGLGFITDICPFGLFPHLSQYNGE